MPVRKVLGGYKIDNVPKVHKTKKAAIKQLAAIKVSQESRKKRRK